MSWKIGAAIKCLVDVVGELDDTELILFFLTVMFISVHALL